MHHGKIIDRVKNYKVIDCISCCLIHVIPIPSDKEIGQLYKEEFYTKKKPKYFKESEEDLDWWKLTYSNYYKILEKYTKRRKLLEIGSGPGYFLSCGNKLGWNVLGLEPSKEAHLYSKKLGVDVVNGFFTEKFIQKYGKFDVVSAMFVLEHLINPHSFIENIKNSLKKNGLIFLISPNDYNPLQLILNKKMGYKPWWISSPQHINYFNFQSINKFLCRKGFEIIDQYSTFPMEYYLLSGDNYVANPTTGRKCHSKRKEFEINMYKHGYEHLNHLYKKLSESELGREFVIIAKLRVEQINMKSNDSFKPLLKKIKVVGFDFDDTLVDEQYSIQGRWKKVLKKYSYLSPILLKTFFEVYKIKGFKYKRHINLTLEKLGIDYKFVKPIVDDFLSSHYKEKLIPGVGELLKLLNHKGIKIGIITNGNQENQERRIMKAGLTKFLDFVFYADKFKKPNPVFLKSCLMKLGVKNKSEFLYIGNDYLEDIKYARELGIRSFLIGNKVIPGDYISFQNLRELSDLIRKCD